MKRATHLLLCMCLILSAFGCATPAVPAASDTPETPDTVQSTPAPSQTPDEGAALIDTILKEADARKEAILNSETAIAQGDAFIEGETYGRTAYYVSNAGDDTNDGLSPENAWATVERVSSAKLKRGDAVFFERGGEWYGQLFGKDGVTYSAYGEGEKPRLYGTSRDAGDVKDWTLLDGTENIWVYKEAVLDCGCIVFNEGEASGVRITPWYVDGRWVCADAKTKAFDVTEDLAEDLNFYSATDIFSDDPVAGTEGRSDKGLLYLRSDAGNPAEVFSSVRLMLWGNTVLPGENNVFDNLAILYCGGHGIYNWGSRLVVQNCEFGWIGGCIHFYNESSEPVRFGNGVENDGSYDLYTVRNCYFHDIYDAGASNQNDGRMENITYAGNLIERCNYGIEVFCWTKADGDGNENIYRNLLVEDNYILRSGYGWAKQRPDT